MKKLILILLLLTQPSFADIGIYGHIANNTCGLCAIPSYIEIRRCEIILETSGGDIMTVSKVNPFLNFAGQFTPNNTIDLYHIHADCPEYMYIVFYSTDFQLIDNTENQINGIAFYR